MYTYGKQNQNTAFSVFTLQFVSIDQKTKGKKVKQRKDLESFCPCRVDPNLLIYNSQFEIVQNSDTDYRHMIRLGLAPVH